MIIRLVPRGRLKGDVITEEEAGEVMIEEIGVMQGRGPEPGNAGGLQRSEKAGRPISFGDPRRNQLCYHFEFFPITLILDFWSPEPSIYAPVGGLTTYSMAFFPH